MKLYEIDEAIEKCFDAETGELIDQNMFKELLIDREKKIESVALWIKDLKAEVEALKAEKQAFADRQKAAENKAENLKKFLAFACNEQNFKTTKAAITFRSNKSVQVTDLFAIPQQYLRVKEPEPDKAAIKKAIEAGETVNGAILIESKSCSIK